MLGPAPRFHAPVPATVPMFRDPCPMQARLLKPPAWRDQPHEQVLRIGLRALLLGYSGELPDGARVCADATGALWLQRPHCSPAGPLDQAGSGHAGEDLIFDRAFAALAAPGHDPMPPDSRADSPPEAGGLDQGRARLAVLARQLQAIPALSAAIDLDPAADRPTLMIAPRGTSWLMAVMVASATDHLRALLTLTHWPEDLDRWCHMLQQSLAFNDLRLLGPELQLVLAPDADMLLLQAVFDPDRFEAAQLQALLGRMLAARELLYDRLQVPQASPGRVLEVDSPLHLPLNALRG